MRSSPFVLLVIILAVLATSFYFLVQAEGGFRELPRLLERAGVPVPEIQMSKPKIQMPQPKDQMGVDVPKSEPVEMTAAPATPVDSRFSQGACATDADCVPAGCSGEVCSSDPDVISMCEFSEDFPNVRGLTCGCTAGACGWQ